MEALNCSCTFHPVTSLVHYSRPAAAIGNTSAAIRCPSKLRRDAPTLITTLITWSASSGMRGFRSPSRSTFRPSASSSLVGGQQGESGALSEQDATPSVSSAVGLVVPRKAADVVQEFYDRINQRDYAGVASLFAEECEYEDFNFSHTTRGRQEVLKFFEKVMSSFGTELKFVIDDMTRDDPNAVGVIWHLDWRGKAFPFSRGCSFYRCVVNSAGERHIRFARDIVEPATKPGDVSMGALRLVTSLFERFPQLADRL